MCSGPPASSPVSVRAAAAGGAGSVISLLAWLAVGVAAALVCPEASREGLRPPGARLVVQGLSELQQRLAVALDRDAPPVGRMAAGTLGLGAPTCPVPRPGPGKPPGRDRRRCGSVGPSTGTDHRGRSPGISPPPPRRTSGHLLAPGIGRSPSLLLLSGDPNVAATEAVAQGRCRGAAGPLFQPMGPGCGGSFAAPDRASRLVQGNRSSGSTADPRSRGRARQGR